MKKVKFLEIKKFVLITLSFFAIFNYNTNLLSMQKLENSIELNNTQEAELTLIKNPIRANKSASCIIVLKSVSKTIKQYLLEPCKQPCKNTIISCSHLCDNISLGRVCFVLFIGVNQIIAAGYNVYLNLKNKDE